MRKVAKCWGIRAVAALDRARRCAQSSDMKRVAHIRRGFSFAIVAVLAAALASTPAMARSHSFSGGHGGGFSGGRGGFSGGHGGFVGRGGPSVGGPRGYMGVS